MKPIVINIILVIALIAGNITSSQAQSAEQLYQKGLMKEEGEGALQEAIVLYNQIADNLSASISLRAKALLHVGMCFEKLGTQEAVKAYQRLVNNFPTQKNEVAIAGERLSRLILIEGEISETPLTPKFTKIKIPSRLSWSVALSPDGKDLALVSDKKLWKMPLSGNLGPGFSGTPVQLNTEGIEVDHQAGLSWSNNGKWIAFNEFPLAEKPEKEKMNQSIFVVSSKGGKPTKVIENYRYVRVVNYKISLSPDGNNLAFTSVENDKQHVYTTQVAGGTPKRLADIQAREPVFSPDGNWIAYVEDKNMGVGGGNLWIVPENGGVPKLVAKAGMAFSPVWSPDGSTIAFLDDDKRGQINFIRLPKGNEAIGKVTSIEAPAGTENVGLAGWTSENKIGVLLRSKVEYALYTLPSKGGQAAMVLNDCFAVQPRWSPDGKQIFYATPLKEGSEGTSPLVFASVSANGGNGKSLPKYQEGESINLRTYQGGNRISRDGKMIIAAAWTPKDTSYSNPLYPYYKIWKIPIDGSKSIQITNKQGPYADLAPCWSPDGKKVAFLRFHITKSSTEESDEAGIYIINSSGGETEILTSISGKYIFSLVWSPDGKMIAYFTKEKEAPNTSYMNVINVENGAIRVLGEVSDVYSNTELAWSPDSKQIAFNVEDYVSNLIKIKVMSLSDGSIKDIKTNMVDVKIYHFDWSPDGERFVFGGYKGGDREFWFLEDFLPLEKLQQQPGLEIAKASEGIAIKQVWKGIEADNCGSVSLDGKYLSFVDWETGDLAIRDLKKETSRRLTKEGTYEDPNQFAYSSTISPDGKQVAYAWFYPGMTYELRLVEMDNPVPRTLYSNKNESVFPAFWLSDSKKLIAKRYLFNSNETKTQIVSIVIPNGSVNVLKTIESECQMRLCSSSDNKYIAYEYPSDLNNENYDIHLLSMDGTYETYLTNHPANDRLLGWIPGSNEVLFTSNRSGSWDLWSVQIENRKPSGLPVRILPEIGEISPLGFTQEGSLYYSIFSRMFTGLITSFNMGAGITGLEESKKSLPGSVCVVEWSPDGESLAYVKEDKRPDDYFQQLYILDLTTGTERSFCDNFRVNNSIRWSPDSRTILAVGRDENKRGQQNYNGGIYTIDTKTGQLSEILLLREIKDIVNPIRLAVAEWSSDGKSIYYLNRYQLGGQIVKRDLKTGEEKVIYAGDNLKRILRLSPASDNLLFAYENTESKKIHLCTIPAEGGNAKEICTSQETDRLRTAVWSPDGNDIFFTETPTLNYSKLWRVSANGGTPQNICQLPHLDVDLSIHPSGQKIALSYYEQTTEIRVMENLGREVAELQSRNE